MLKIKPLGGNIQLEMEQAKAGALDTSSRESAVEFAKVIAVPNEYFEENYKIKVGDTVFVKSWAIDIITHQDKKYFFLNITSGGLLAVVK